MATIHSKMNWFDQNRLEHVDQIWNAASPQVREIDCNKGKNEEFNFKNEFQKNSKNTYQGNEASESKYKIREEKIAIDFSIEMKNVRPKCF